MLYDVRVIMRHARDNKEHARFTVLSGVSLRVAHDYIHTVLDSGYPQRVGEAVEALKGLHPGGEFHVRMVTEEA